MRIKPIFIPISAAVALLVFTSVPAQTLVEVVRQTLDTNPDVQVVVNQRRAVEQEMKQARAGYFPQADINVGHGWETSNNPTTRNAGNRSRNLDRSEAEIQIRQLLFDGFGTQSEVERQKARTNSRAYSTFGTSEVIALRAIEAYLDVRRERELVSLAEENLAAHQKTYDRIMKRGERGVGRKSDTQQALGRLALARTNLMAEQNNLKDAMVVYEQIVGEKPGDLSEPPSLEYLFSPELEDSWGLPSSLDEAITIALDNHPTLRSAEADIDAARAQETAAKSKFYPRVHLEISGTENNDLDGIPGPNRDGQIMVRGRYNFTAGKDQARREETAYLLNEAKEVRNRTRRQVIESVQLSWNAYETAKTQLDYFKIHVDASEAAADAYEKQFNIGQRSLLDLLDSKNELFTARTEYVNGKTTLMNSVYRILAGTGKLLWALEVDLPEEAVVLN